MSAPATLQGGFAGTGPYRITTPTVTNNATAGTVQVNANTKFATNLPLGFGMLITDIEWVAAFNTHPIISVPQHITGWQTIGQITEALARTVVVQSDPVDVDIYFDEWWAITIQSTAASIASNLENRQKALERHKMQRPWLTVAQTLNLIVSVIPTSDNTQNGPNTSVYSRIYYDIIALNATQQSYLSQRIQIAGQA